MAAAKVRISRPVCEPDLGERYAGASHVKGNEDPVGHRDRCNAYRNDDHDRGCYSTRAADPKTQDKLALGLDEVTQLVLLMDADKNGKISRQEFMKFMEAEFDRWIRIRAENSTSPN
jgi:hypothetical protein